MGCFSYLCKECDKPVYSNSFSGQPVKLFLLKGGKTAQSMEGQYDSYGAVFTEDLEDSLEWHEDWGDLVDLHYNEDNSTGFAAIHSSCLREGMEPTTISKDDPNQGWGENWETMASTSKDFDYDELEER